MNYLAIDTSGKSLIVLLGVGDKIYKYNDKECGVRHSVSLMPQVENLLEAAGVAVKDLDFIATVVGAGSFTGIRIGVSTAKALCFANGLPALSITSFDCLAYNKGKGKTLCVLNAGHGGYYACGYDENKRVIMPPEYIMHDRLLELSREYFIVSDGEIGGVDLAIGDFCEGLISAVAALKDNATLDLESIVPVYVRKSQAEEGR